MKEKESAETCFGCGVDNPRGLQLSPHIRVEDGEVVIGVRVDEEFSGFDGVVHGGISATLLDEAMSAWCTRVLGVKAVTGEITVKFSSPVPTETDLIVRARGNRQGRKVLCSGEITNPSGKVLVEAGGTWVITGGATAGETTA